MAGWNGSNGGTSASPKKSVKPKQQLALGKGALAGLLVVVAAGLAAYFLLPREKPTVKEATTDKPKAIAEVKPAAIKPEAPKVEQKVVETDPSKQIVAVLSCTTNSGLGQICERYKTADGKTHKVYRPAKPPMFKHQTDQLLAMALCGDDKRGMPPLPIGRNLDKQFMDSLKTPIEISPDDSPEAVARKKRVIEARKQVDELMRQGIGFTQILQDHQKLLSDNKKLRDEMVREIKKINAEWDAETTKKALDKVNAALREMGISEIEAPKTPKERAAERAARQMQR